MSVQMILGMNIEDGTSGDDAWLRYYRPALECIANAAKDAGIAKPTKASLEISFKSVEAGHTLVEVIACVE